MRWLAGIKFDQTVQRVEEHLRAAVAAWRPKSVVEFLQVLRGVQLVVAATLAAEIGQTARFDKPRQLMI